MFIYTAGVVGMGAMGAEIAQVISYAGIPVVAKDVNDEAVQRGLETCRKIYQARVNKGKMTPEEMASKMNLIRPTTSYDAFKEVDLVIEAVPERMPLKQDVFRELDRVCPPSAILASNTSSLSISAIANATNRADHVLGLHFFYPAHVMKLVEVIPGLATSQEVVDAAISFAESLRKIPVRVQECPGFLVNRLLMPYLNEAVFCLEEGVASMSEIDRTVTGFGLPMGPFTLVDALGLDVCVEVGRLLSEGFGGRMAPAGLWTLLAERKRWGVKAGKGFYRHQSDQDGQGTEGDPEMEELLKTARTAHPRPKGPWGIERLLYPMINEAIYCVQERIASPAEIDLAMVAGIGFPQDKGGLLKYADAIGLDQILSKLEEFERVLGDRFHPAYRLRQMAQAGWHGAKTKRGFYEYS